MACVVSQFGGRRKENPIALRQRQSNPRLLQPEESLPPRKSKRATLFHRSHRVGQVESSVTLSHTTSILSKAQSAGNGQPFGFARNFTSSFLAFLEGSPLEPRPQEKVRPGA